MNLFNFKLFGTNGFEKTTQYLQSELLERKFTIDIYRINQIYAENSVYLLLMNDGQDGNALEVLDSLNFLHKKDRLAPLIVVGIHCNEDRMQEYGTAFSADYLGRGSKAGLYSKFVMGELIPYLRSFLKIKNFKEKAIFGCSMGGLSALDIAWNNPHEFQKIGMFSPSLWWRRKAYDKGYNDNTDKLMLLQIRYGKYYSWLRFFFECGALDENADRNHNGVIDSIDDCLDIIKELKKLGYSNQQITYLELSDGKHDLPTWKKTLPLFLEWGFKH